MANVCAKIRKALKMARNRLVRAKAFMEVTDPLDAKNTIRAAMRKQTTIAEEA